MVDEDLEFEDEVKLVSDVSPTLTGDVVYFQDQSELSQNPPKMQKRMMNKYLEFFLYYSNLYRKPSERSLANPYHRKKS